VKGQGKLNRRVILKVCWCCLSKFVNACRNYSLPKLVRFYWDKVQ